MKSEFVHLHNHSDYSLLDGAQNVEVLVNTIGDLGMDSVALTEHGNMFSVIPYYKAARKKGIKPIIGCEIYVAQGSRFDKKVRAEGGWGNNHLVLLAQNYTGYKNLMKLVTHGYLEGFYYRPRIDKELLRNHSDGLICMSACLKGEVPEKMLKGNWKGAQETAMEFAEMFPDRYYLEIQNHGIPEEAQNMENMIKLSKDLGLPLVATNDAHYAKKEHSDAHDVHICLGTGKERSDPNRLRYATAEFYFKTQDEMYNMFKHVPEALENTRRIADSVDVEIPMGTYHLPNFPIPKDAQIQDPDEYLRVLSEDGVKQLYGEVNPELQDRLTHELSVIKKMGFAGYFLITGDFVQYAKDQHIPVGPGRGSAAGSLVSYALGITTIDPMKHDLLFERFLNPERVSMPDIDIDFCIERRQEVIDYIKRQYGEESVTQIITFGKMKARAVVRDVGRVLGYPFGEVDKIAKMIPEGPKVKLQKTIDENPDFKKLADGPYKELIDFSLILEGMNRHASTHAAGVVITPGPLTDYVPLYKSNKDDITTQYDMKGLEDLGLLKMDFLGLRNLTVIDRAVKLIKEKGVEVDIEKIPMDDPKVYELFAKGLTIGIFQFESSGMREFLKKLKPTVIEDLIAMNALYRPGPMENIDDFIDQKRGRKKVSYLHPDMETILKETYGIIVYQEQVMQLANAIAGFTLADADLMRRAMGKKIASLMTEMSVKFLDGAVAKGIKKKTAQKIFDLIEKFAQYGFNKSHSTAYAYVAYQTAWLKTHYPAEFMSANLTSEMTTTNRVVILINECKKLDIEVNSPDLNVSYVQFHPVNDKTISFGLNAIKNVGTKALEKIIENRDKDGAFKSLFDFVSRVDLRTVNRKVLESLILAGAMDNLDGTREQMFSAIDDALKYGQQLNQNNHRDQFDLFGLAANGQHELVKAPTLPEADTWSEKERLEKEKDVTGLYLTGHPLLKHSEDLEELSTFDFTDKLNRGGASAPVRVGGIINNKKIHLDRKQKRMSFFNMECLGGQAEILCFSRTYEQYGSLIENDNVVFVVGKPTDNSDFSDLKLIADEIVPLELARNHFSKRVNVQIDPEIHKSKDIQELQTVAKNFPGKCKLVFYIPDGDHKKQIIAHNIKVSSDKPFIDQLRDKYGKQNVWISS
ncbi:MAG: DNA polymerase III subunit alpha [Candidatus Marinimicrobia bacterium]|nr:DNA polymerase III subunit alpha [Candidatus Neomarinimicrobiota bacterium]